MTEKIELLKQEDVIKLKDDNTKWIMSHTMFTVSDFTSTMLASYTGGSDKLMEWSKNGVFAEVLASGKSWRNGKVRLSIEFISDEVNQNQFPFGDIPNINDLINLGKMTEKIELLKQEDVIKLKDNNTKWIMYYTTFTVSDFTSQLLERYSSNEESKEWSKNGVSADVMASGKSWRNGKVRLSIEFISDEVNQNKSPFSDIPNINDLFNKFSGN